MIAGGFNCGLVKKYPNKLNGHHKIMKLEIKAGNIPQIKQTGKCLPKDLLSNAVLNGDYLRNISIFSGKKKIPPIKCPYPIK